MDTNRTIIDIDMKKQQVRVNYLRAIGEEKPRVRFAYTYSKNC